MGVVVHPRHIETIQGCWQHRQHASQQACHWALGCEQICWKPRSLGTYSWTLSTKLEMSLAWNSGKPTNRSWPYREAKPMSQGFFVRQRFRSLETTMWFMFPDSSTCKSQSSAEPQKLRSCDHPIRTRMTSMVRAEHPHVQNHVSGPKNIKKLRSDLATWKQRLEVGSPESQSSFHQVCWWHSLKFQIFVLLLGLTFLVYPPFI